SGIDFDQLRDPWGMPFQTKFSTEKEMDLLEITTAGADKRFGTTDDFSISKISWPYFKPIGEAIGRVIEDYYKRTGLLLRDEGALKSELLKEGIDLDSLKDRWGNGYYAGFKSESQ